MSQEHEKDEKEREILTSTETVTLKRQGTSDMLLLPAHWKKTIPQLHTSPLVFNVHIEKDADGRIFIVFEKEKELHNET